ncbi:MAG TPA: hypothetical protein VFF06_32705 [Polyangia bacterium]|nr:hypothetical protein [Polyangia bacterium]
MKVFCVAALIVAALARPAAADEKKADDKKADDKKTTAQKGIWKILVKPGAKWVLRETIGDKKDTITVETYDVRKVGAADVARLRWTLKSGKDKRDVGDSDSGRYTQVAVTDAGLYVLSADMDDAKVAEALKKKPSRSDPPRPYQGTKQNQGRYLTVESADTVCMGWGPLPGAGDCEDTCEGEVCISSTAGVTKLSGTWAPGVTIFEAQ